MGKTGNDKQALNNTLEVFAEQGMEALMAAWSRLTPSEQRLVAFHKEHLKELARKSDLTKKAS